MPRITTHRVVPHHVYRLLSLVCFLLLASTSINAQTTSPTDTTTPLALSPGSPVGSYAVSGFENVNAYNGNLSFHLPLITVGGRGVAMSSILGIDSKGWTVRHVATTDANGFPVDVYTPVANPWTPRAGYGAGKMAGRRSGLYPDQTCGATRYIYQQTLTRLTFVASDGTEYEFRDQLTGGQPAPVTNPCMTTGASRGTVFVTADGSAATFISDAVIYDRPQSKGGGSVQYLSGYLILRDGMRYRIDNGDVSWMRDRNGNRLLFGYTDGRVTSIADSLNRQVTYTYANFVNTFSDQITFKGFGGLNRTILVNYTRLQFSLRTTNPRNEPASRYQIQTYRGLFPELNNASSTTTWNPFVVSSVTLPNNKQYQLLYNCFAELARVTVPTGGAIEYDYTANSGAINGGDGYQIYRRVKERRVYHDGSNLEGYTTFSESVNPATVDQRNAGGTLLSREKHYYHGNPLDSLFNAGAVFYPGYLEGREFKTEAYASDGLTVLRRLETTWVNRAPVSWWNPVNGDEPPNDPRVTDTTTTLTDVTPNLVSRRTFGYDDSVPFNNRTDVYEYDFGSGTAGALVRRTHTDYLKTNSVNSTDYTTTSIHIRSLPTQIQIFDAAGVEKARTTFEYDNYASDSNHAPLEPRFNISGLDSGFTPSYVTRGNVTRRTGWILSAGTQLHSYLQYDVAGNVVKTVDARGYATTFEFADRYGAPDTEAQGNTAPPELSGQTSYAFATKVTNAAGHLSFAQFDYYLGRPVNGEDPNGIVTSGSYNDSLDRPTQVKRASGTSAANQTTFAYDDGTRTLTVTSDLTSNNDNGLVSKVVYDGLGRSKETRQYEGGTNYIKTEQQYDALGRADKVSNPYRPYLSESAVWTTTCFDTLGRVTSVTTPDSAVVSTAYSGNAVTVTDQTGKLRRSITDGLGRLIRVDEPNGSNSLGDVSSPNQSTTYNYDVLDNLTGVTQGVQTRTFVYDSLQRLTSATNPESGTVTYGYDANSNLTSKIDARSITTTMAYDAINRVISKSYNNSPQTPAVSCFYDGQTLPEGAPTFSRGYSTGRLVAVTYGSGSSEGSYRGYDQMGRVVTQSQRTDAVNYLVEASYYANSSLHTHTYPAVPGAGDRRAVTYTNDAAGRLASLSSSATTYAPAASVSSIGYASHHALNSETYGNGLTHAIDYNNRLQPTQIKLGTSGNPTSVVSLGYSYGTTNNNGNVLTHTYSGGGLSYTESFAYDSLNRLTTSNENSGSNWSQTNGYDRYSNRWIDLGGGNQSLYFNTSNNRISGASYDSAGNLLNDGSHTYTYDAENKIAKVDNLSAYIYDGEGQRVRKLIGENLRFIYGIGGQLIAEFSGSSGALQKEYIYGASGLLATIEPAAVNSNGTRYATPDHLGSPRVVTNSGASVISRHDYMPFGEELGSGVGGRTLGMGFGVAEGLRKKFTSHERDVEIGLDYMQARYYQGLQGRFTSADPLLASGASGNPQTWNRYAYVLNNPLRLIDPTGLNNEEADEQDKQKQVVKPMEDKGIEKRVKEIQSNAKPLAAGETPKPTTVEQIQGEQTTLQNATVVMPDGQGEIANGYMQPIALVILDQGGNIITDPNLTVTEYASPANDDAKVLYDASKAETTNGVAVQQQPNGVFYDLQIRGFNPSQKPMDIQTKQDLVIKSGTTNLFMIQGNKIRMNDANRSITFTPGTLRKFGN